jgi:hypothetical protein
MNKELQDAKISNLDVSSRIHPGIHRRNMPNGDDEVGNAALEPWLAKDSALAVPWHHNFQTLKEPMH